MNDVQYTAAVYVELCAHLGRCTSGEIEIPIDIEDGHVPVSYVEDVLHVLEATRDEYVEKLELSVDVEVEGVTEEDFDIGE